MGHAGVAPFAIVILAMSSGTSEAFFDRQALEARAGGPVVRFHVIDPAFGLPAPACSRPCCCEETYSYPAYAFPEVLWPDRIHARERAGPPHLHRLPRYFPSGKRRP